MAAWASSTSGAICGSTWTSRSSSAASRTRDATLWLKREFRAVASLRHPNLVELYELVAHERSCYFTMEYLPGVDPRRWVERRPRVAGRRVAARHATQPTRSAPPLQEAHTESTDAGADTVAAAAATPRGRAARRLRARAQRARAARRGARVPPRARRDPPRRQAVERDRRRRPRQAARLRARARAPPRRRRTSRARRAIVGTAAYLAPEYIEQLVVSPAMDVYALGVLAFELCTGAPPFGGALHVLSRLQRSASVPRAVERSTRRCPHDLDELIDRDARRAIPTQRPTALADRDALTGDAVAAARARAASCAFVGREAELARARRRGSRIRRRAAGSCSSPARRASGKTALIDEALGRARGARDR